VYGFSATISGKCSMGISRQLSMILIFSVALRAAAEVLSLVDYVCFIVCNFVTVITGKR